MPEGGVRLDRHHAIADPLQLLGPGQARHVGDVAGGYPHEPFGEAAGKPPAALRAVLRGDGRFAPAQGFLPPDGGLEGSPVLSQVRLRKRGHESSKVHPASASRAGPRTASDGTGGRRGEQQDHLIKRPAVLVVQVRRPRLPVPGARGRQEMNDRARKGVVLALAAPLVRTAVRPVRRLRRREQTEFRDRTIGLDGGRRPRRKLVDMSTAGHTRSRPGLERRRRAPASG